MRKFIEHNGCRIVYRVVGEGPPILLIQGVATPGDAWRPQVETLAKQFRCITFDNRGMGESQPAGEVLSVHLMVQDICAILDAEGFKSAHIVGHSLGGLISLQLALLHRQRVRSLALLCTFANGRAVGPLSWKLCWYGMRSKIGTRAMRRQAFLHLLLPKCILDRSDHNLLAKEYAEHFGHDLADSPAITSRQLTAMRAVNVTSRLGELSGIPTLVVSSVEDPIAHPQLGKALAEGIPNSQYHLMANASHALPLHDRHSVNELLFQHLTK